jgi:outer membrane murein-binding lipoprotein Lpp
VPRNRNQPSATPVLRAGATVGNRQWVEWVDQGLKRAHWPASRATQIGLLMAIALAVAALYLMQSSEIVTTSRRVQDLRDQVAQLRQANEQLAIDISAAGSIEQLTQRAQAMGFQPAPETVYLPVQYVPIDDMPSIQDTDKP